MEYQKVIPTSGGGQFGAEVIFSLPQFGDFFSDMALNVVLSQTSAAAASVPAVPADPAPIAAANNQVNEYATLLDGNKLYQVDSVKSVIRSFEYLGHIKYDGTLVEEGE